ncbi:hypothetical protein LWP59_03475 [Amycolatopsis acidiphila]|uniref:hypothetical protein n=1 Tax=Amycolatopsis acidiphila TaxID=715473 RepID=UPI001E61E7CA|nr:hypothetical protein [Amycolatopsis acidiphila]UIJ60757.1 hypothetical protein LWP59_03475 [Amycolatopsis acidiphila]
MSTDELRQAAFGDAPVVPVGAPRSPRAKLLTAIVLGAQGRYAGAASLLGEVAKGRDPVLAALALSAFASHRRQLGGHRAAFGPDGAALRLVAGLSGHAEPDGIDAAGARADALLGLAADNLGVGRLAVARRLLARVRAESWRSQVRRGWVTAEIELADGQARAAVAPAEAALGLATASGALRHVVKSQLVLAAALGATGERERAVHLVDEALGVSDKYALRSLGWPAGLLAAEHGSDLYGRDRFRVDAVLHAVLLRSDPEGRRLARDSPWVPV